jgi:hypothetical protein
MTTTASVATTSSTLRAFSRAVMSKVYAESGGSEPPLILALGGGRQHFRVRLEVPVAPTRLGAPPLPPNGEREPR